MPPSLTLRSVKGADLTPTEEENNHLRHEERIDTNATAIAAIVPNGIADVYASGNNLYVDDDDGNTYGPFAVPRPLLTFVGTWATATSYSRNNLVYVQGVGLVLVLQAHTSASPFDIDRQISGGDVYDLVAPSAASYDFGFVMGPTAPDSGGLVGNPAPIPRAITIPANLAGTSYYAGDDPDTDQVYSLRDDGVEIGTITVGSGTAAGMVTLATTSGAGKLVAAGSVMTMVAPSDGTAQDTSISNWVFTIAAEVTV